MSSSLNSLAFVLVAFGANLAHAQVAQATSCDPAVKPFTPFDVPAYMGRWYEHKRIPSPFQNGTCVFADISFNCDGSINLINTQTDPTTNKKITTVGTATQPEGSNVGSFHAKFTGGPVVESDYCIMDTDYKNYSVVYSCTLGRASPGTFLSWILKRDPAADVDEMVNPIIEKMGLDKSQYRKTSQVNCKYAATP